jgi:hypothetical protein
LIKTGVENTPGNPIDESAFPKIGTMSGGVSFASGALDALAGRFADNHNDHAWTQVRNVFVDISQGKLQNWKTLKDRIKDRKVLANFDHALENLKETSVERLKPRLFRDLARNSRSDEAVKWVLPLAR